MKPTKDCSSPSKVRKSQWCNIVIPAEESSHIPNGSSQGSCQKLRARRLALLRK